MKHYIFLFLLLGSLQVQAQRRLRLDECREMALEYNKTLQKAGLDEQKALAGQKQARTNYYPKLDGSGSVLFMPQMDNIDIPGFFLPTADANGNPTGESDAWFPGLSLNTEKLRVYQAQLAMQIPIYAGGQIRYGNQMADRGVNIAQNAFGLETDKVIQSTDEVYWQLVSLGENLKVAGVYVNMLDSLEDQLSAMYDLGLTPKSEQLKVTVQKNDAELALLRARNGYKLLKMRLCQVVGLPLDTEFEPDQQLDGDMVLPDMANAWAVAEANRRELKMMDDQLAIADLQKKSVAGAYLPSVGAQVSYGYVNVPNMVDWRGNTQIAGSVSVPVFHWGEKKHKLAAAQLEIDKARLDAENTRQLLQLEVEQLVLKVEEAYQAIQLANKSCAQARESLDEVQVSYEAGLNGTTDLLNAQAAWQKAQAARIGALTEFEIAKTAYNKGLGLLHSGEAVRN